MILWKLFGGYTRRTKNPLAFSVCFVNPKSIHSRKRIKMQTRVKPEKGNMRLMLMNKGLNAYLSQ